MEEHFLSYEELNKVFENIADTLFDLKKEFLKEY